MYKKPEHLFDLADGTHVRYGDILYHPDRRNVGWYCIAEFKPSDHETVTVRAPNGAVPHVKISELRKNPPVVRRCKTCNQILPKREINDF